MQLQYCDVFFSHFDGWHGVLIKFLIYMHCLLGHTAYTNDN